MQHSREYAAAMKRIEAERHNVLPDPKPYPVVTGSGRPLSDSLPDGPKPCRQVGTWQVGRGDGLPVNAIRGAMEQALEDIEQVAGAKLAHGCCAAALPELKGE